MAPVPTPCAWCGPPPAPLKKGERPISHGICPACAEAFKAAAGKVN